ncbi:Na+/H+ antiporter subunit E [Magnetospirillum sp. UT-4]|uniref:Na+/H+ antiporter subunit E n=1 Tax=Magnetospirillum sp. UT-4 TaxID=2681467 RepID=UPI001380046F|nr:Na+/H+ antiporter subunit E [Magnetospirillum sp. UT-4]CAA7615326.1 Membrane bound protein complex subunit mbxA [Magnetospirillum sp. UT-4]
MDRARGVILLFASLLVFWLVLSGTAASDVVLVGIAAAAVIAMAFAGNLSFLAEFRATPSAVVAAFLYVGYFAKELVKANLAVARIVTSPALPLNPGFVKVRTRLKSRVGRALLANSITLTPGTLTVEMEGEWLYIHWVSVESPEVEAATAAIVAGFEHYLEAMYG